ncbi:hypothetical protein C3K47_08820 [Solitalea longa]|uniref:DUF4175 domain-containing protein n=1 Tax=Solitalea longa TaxID=2079460 RepID=A0A2S5A4C1_9SPHI|nr:DUF4175 family protein [Solitalea longa]POY37149.1 hypothetical protein C3K47_08820 [Solitalea longa]
MANQNSNYDYLIGKLDEFIRKYYKNRLIKGSLYVTAILAAFFLVLTVTEYYSFLSTFSRTLIFFGFLILSAIVLALYVIKPLLSLFKLGSVINHQQASEIIGRHFPEVKDKLLNTLQLKQMANQMADNKLIEASINQKIIQLKPIPFTSAINLGENKKYLKFALPPLLALLILGAAAPAVLKDGTNRLVNYSQPFERKAPFQIEIINKKLSALQNEDLTVNVKLTGDEIPQDIYLIEGENRYKLDKKNILEFTYTFKNLQKSQNFRFLADGFYSKEYSLSVLPNPLLLNFEVNLVYPSYTKKVNETLQNTGDFSVPAGTLVSWHFKTSNTGQLDVVIDGVSQPAEKRSETSFLYNKKLFKTARYAVQTKNGYVLKKDSLNYSIEVVPDVNPSINVIERFDSLTTKQFYFSGDIKDDYGFSKLTFNYQILNKDKKKIYTKFIPINTSQTSETYFYNWDLEESGISQGDEISYYFEIFDNDGVNGIKSTKSSIKTLKTLSKNEIDRQLDEKREALKDKMEKTLRQASKIERDAKKLNDKLADKKNLSFEEKKQIADLIEKQKQLEQNIQEIQQENKLNNQQNNELNEQDQRILDKQKQLEEMFDNVLDEKTKEILENLQKMMEENNKNLTRDQLENMRMDNKSLEKELDRLLELYKQLEFEQKLQQNIDKLDQLSQKQENLSEKSKDKNTDAENLKNEQDNINKDFEDLKKDMDDLEKKDEELENKNNFDNPEKEQQDIQKDLNNSSEQLQKENKSKASESQKNAANKMKNLSQKMQQMQQQMEGMKLDIDIEGLRQVLENLLKVSFDQEKLMQQFKSLGVNDAGFNSLVQKQKSLKDDLGMVSDSIFSLSKRIFQIETFVNKEIETINKYMDKTMESLAERRTAEAAGNQQYIMTSVNNLAVMLSEVLDQLQNQQASMGKGKSKSKNKKPSLSQLSKMQDELNKQMQQMKNGMKPGQVPRGQQSEQIAKMARQQQAIRNSLQDISKEQNKDGKGKLGDLDKLSKDMERTETDLYNKQLTQEMLKRQQEIKTRLLEAEKAERERDEDEKREAKQGKEQTADFKAVYDQYQKVKQKELELLKTLPPGVSSFYKSKINAYFNLLNNGK